MCYIYNSQYNQIPAVRHLMMGLIKFKLHKPISVVRHFMVGSIKFKLYYHIKAQSRETT